MKYLCDNQPMPLTLEASDINEVKWWVDASYAVHPNMRSHTGGIMTLGSGGVYAVFAKSKLNTRSSTESELVGLHDVMPQILWTRSFLKSQGYENSITIVGQDNQSAMLLEKHARASISKWTHHIDIHYFFIADRISSGDLEVKWEGNNQPK